MRPAERSYLQKHLSMAKRKQQILETAIEIIATQGYAKLTMRALARASGMKLGALQYHFRTWDELLVALATYIGAEYRPHQSLDLMTPNEYLQHLAPA